MGNISSKEANQRVETIKYVAEKAMVVIRLAEARNSRCFNEVQTFAMQTLRPYDDVRASILMNDAMSCRDIYKRGDVAGACDSLINSIKTNTGAVFKGMLDYLKNHYNV